MSTSTWGLNGQGWCCRTIRVGTKDVFIALMREAVTSWRWLAFANGRALGTFDGITIAKREAVKKAKEEFT